MTKKVFRRMCVETSLGTSIFWALISKIYIFAPVSPEKKIDLDIEKHIKPKNMATSTQRGTCNHLYVDRLIPSASYGI